MTYLIISQVVVMELTPRIPNTGNWLQFLQATPAILPGESVLAYYIFWHNDLGA